MIKKISVSISALLALSSAAFGATLNPIQLLNPAGSTSGQTIVSTGASSAPAWGGVGLNGLAAQPANTVVANASGSSAAPTALAMPSCSTAGTALQWTSGTGFTCASGYASSSGPGAFTTLSASSNDALLYTNTSGQSIPNNAFTAVTGWTKTFDRVNANFNSTTGTFTCPVTAYYQVGAQLTWVAHTGAVNATYAVAVLVNATNVAQGQFFQEGNAIAGVTAQVSTAVLCNSGQTIVLSGYQSSGAAVTLSTSAAQTYFSISRIP